MTTRGNIMGLLSAKGVAYSDKETDRELEVLCEKNGIELPKKSVVQEVIKKDKKKNVQ